MEEMPYVEEIKDEEIEETNEMSEEVLEVAPQQELLEDAPQQEVLEETPTVDILEEVKEFIHENPEDIDLLGIREKFGYTFEQVAESIGITDAYYRKVEKKWVSLTDNVASKLSEFYGFEIKPYTIKPVPKDKLIKREDDSKNKQNTIPDDPEMKLHLALKKKHSELASKIVARYEVLNRIRDIITDIILKEGV